VNQYVCEREKDASESVCVSLSHALCVCVREKGSSECVCLSLSLTHWVCVRRIKVVQRVGGWRGECVCVRERYGS